MSTESKRVCVCVLGDIGHSPRMQNHSISLAESGFQVDIVAYLESIPYKKLTTNQNIKIHSIPAYKNISVFPRYVNYLFKVIFQSILLLFTLMFVPRPTHVLVQNPPSIPSLLIVWIVCRLRKCYFVIDWHNYGYSILSLSLNPSHLIVKLYRFLEFYIGAKSDFEFCVSDAMRNDLKIQIQKNPIVLYDRPQYSFFSLEYSFVEKHKFFTQLQQDYPQIKCDIDNETLFTKYSNKVYLMKENRPVILVSSTSWTEDEDFQILLNALFDFDENHAEKMISNDLSIKVVCVITGKGPLKAYYQEKLKSYSFKHTKFVFPWLKAEDYPLMLASADLGICLHKSSSGLDLPMKVVDMFGNNLPVCAYKYPCIEELVQEGENGCLFSNSNELVNCFTDLLANFPKCKKIENFSSNLKNEFRKSNWNANFQRNALPIFNN